MKSLLVFVILLLLPTLAVAQDALTPKSLEAALRAKPTDADAEKLAERIRAYFGKDAIKNGANAKVDELTVAWAIEAPGATAPKVISADGKFTQALSRAGNTDVYAAVLTLADGAAVRWAYDIDGKKIGNPNPPAGSRGLTYFQTEVYKAPPDSVEKPDVPKGKIIPMPKFESKIFDGTTRDWWLYVPAQYTPDKPACVLVAQDGGGYTRPPFTTVLDNLIAKGEIPVMIGIFIQPGNFKADNRSNRSVEYDTLSDKYARFVLEEVLPDVEKTYKLRHDAESRMITGASSGGICSFTVAWERPNEFHKVLSWVGSFTNIQQGADFKSGGHNYEAMVRKAPKRKIRVFLQDGEQDLDNNNGNWPLANQTLAKSLEFASYDYKFVYGHGFHSNRHGLAILPDSLRWLWRDYKGQ